MAFSAHFAGDADTVFSHREIVAFADAEDSGCGVNGETLCCHSLAFAFDAENFETFRGSAVPGRGDVHIGGRTYVGNARVVERKCPRVGQFRLAGGD